MCPENHLVKSSCNFLSVPLGYHYVLKSNSAFMTVRQGSEEVMHSSGTSVEYETNVQSLEIL